MINSSDTRKALEEARTARERLFTELENLRAREQVDGPSDGLAERTANLNRGIENADNRIAELEAEYGRAAYVERMASDPRNLDTGTPPAADRHDHRPERNETRDAAMRTIERHVDAMETGAADRVEGLVRQNEDGRDWTARYLTAVGSPAYRTAFQKLCQDPQHGHLRFGPEEVEAVRVVSGVQAERTAMAIGAGSSGGFALSFTLDPTIMLSSSGALNPIRQVARTVTTSWNEWRGITSDGVTVAYSAEAAQMTDGSPVLAQPVITCQRWTAFVPFSWELAQDWTGLENELVRLIRDGRDVNDSTAFYSGTTSSSQPNGIMSVLGASQQVVTAGTATLAAGDIWSLKEAVPARFIANTSFLAHPNVIDKIYRLVPNASTSEPALMESRDGAIVGKPAYEWSSVGGTVGTGGTLALAGDFGAAYVVADRLGLTAVPIPALFGGTAAVHFPTGQSGLAVWGRTGANVVNANALRVLTGR